MTERRSVVESGSPEEIEAQQESSAILFGQTVPKRFEKLLVGLRVQEKAGIAPTWAPSEEHIGQVLAGMLVDYRVEVSKFAADCAIVHGRLIGPNGEIESEVGMFTVWIGADLEVKIDKGMVNHQILIEYLGRASFPGQGTKGPMRTYRVMEVLGKSET